MRDNLSAWLTLAGSLMLGACASIGAQPASAAPQRDAGQGAMLSMRAVLVAGDGSLGVFDNGVAGIAAWLRDTGGAEPDQVVRLSASPAIIMRQKVESASSHHVMQAIEGLNPASGQACFVFITSHGIKGEGVALSYDDSVLRPAALDRALTTGCGDAPSVPCVTAAVVLGVVWPTCRTKLGATPGVEGFRKAGSNAA